MFSRKQLAKREAGYRLITGFSDIVMLSSQDARRDCEQFYPRSIGRTEVVPFAVAKPLVDPLEARHVVAKHNLPSKFFYMPGQLWRHKNHLVLLRALEIAVRATPELAVVCTGSPVDTRNPQYPQTVVSLAQELGLAESFRYLGLVDYSDVIALMVASHALVNPSLFEGWSTTVEEAKASNKRLVLSDLRVHREQAEEWGAKYFDPHSPEDLAGVLLECWESQEGETGFGDRYSLERRRFGERFAEAVARAVATR